MKVGSLFAGIGGLDLGLERAGMEIVWQVENEPYCKRVLAKHWPDVKRWDDVRTFPPEGDWSCDLICGGFPCQDISFAGKGAGIDGERSGLWSEFARIIRTLRPCYVLVENVPAILVRGLDRVLGDLAACGYDAEWSTLSACSMGAPHMRQRVFIVAYPESERFNTCWEVAEGSERIIVNGRANWRTSERGVLRMAHGIPSRVHRLRGLGNAVVPQVAEWIGRQLLEGREIGQGP